MGQADSTLWFSYWSSIRLWYTSQDPFSTARQSRFQNYFHTLLLVFLVDQVLASQIKTYLVKLTPHCGSAVGHLSLICTLFSSFFGGASLSITDQDWGRDFMDEAGPTAGQLLVTHLLYTVQDLFSTARQSSFQNSFHCGSAVSHWCKVQNLFSAARQSKFQNSFHTFLFCFCQTDS